ncbi:MAG: Bbp19 family protein [Micavibrio sp.]
MKPFLIPKPVNAPAHLLADSQTLSQQDVERLFARCFSTDDGKKVLAHLQVMTFSRAYGPDASDQQLRYAEGQRALVANILRLIDRGRK